MINDNNGWRTIDSAPKDGTEILGYREDCGIILMRWIAPSEFLNDIEIEELDLDADIRDWFCADYHTGWRLDGDLVPTHWHPLPEYPNQNGGTQ